MARKNILDNIVNEINGIRMQDLVIDDLDETIDINNDNLDKYDTNIRKAIKDLSTLPDYYKILGVSNKDDCKTIKKREMKNCKNTILIKWNHY